MSDIFISNLPAGFAAPATSVEHRLMHEYGGIFVARNGAVAPSKIVFENEKEVTAFQAGLDIAAANIGGFDLELQSAAMDALLAAISDGGNDGLTITPRSADSARRNYQNTVDLWASRVEPALDHWMARGRLAPSIAKRIRGLSPFGQVPEIFALEDEGMFCAKDLSKSIIFSVAPPGASQHLSMLAFDVSEFREAGVREILAGHRWYQTVVSDLPHFTYLGVAEDELPGLGLKKILDGERRFWVPDI